MTEINLFRHAENAVDLEPGEIVFAQGEDGNVMYAVIDGVVEIEVDGRVIDRAEAGGIFGEMALVSGGQRSATARASTAARVAPVGEKQFLLMVEHTPHFALKVMRVMAERLRQRMQVEPG